MQTTPSTTHSVQKKNASKKGILLAALVTPIVLILSLFIPLGSSTVGAYFLQSLGQNKLSAGFDLLTKQGLGAFLAYSNFDPKKPEDCSKLWPAIKSVPLFSSDSSPQWDVGIQYVKNDSVLLDAKLGLLDTTAQGQFASSLSLDVERILQLASATLVDFPSADATKSVETVDKVRQIIASEQLQKLSAQLLIHGWLNGGAVYVQPKVATLQLGNDTLQAGQLNAIQVDGFFNTGSIQKNTLEQIMSDQSGEMLLRNVCSLVDNVSLGALQERTFETGKKQVRPLSVKLKSWDKTLDVLNTTVPETAQQLVNDDKFVEFFYELTTSTSAAGTQPTLLDFRNQLRSEFRKDELRLDIDPQNFADIKTGFQWDIQMELLVDTSFQPLNAYQSYAKAGLTPQGVALFFGRETRVDDKRVVTLCKVLCENNFVLIGSTSPSNFRGEERPQVARVEDVLQSVASQDDTKRVQEKMQRVGNKLGEILTEQIDFSTLFGSLLALPSVDGGSNPMQSELPCSGRAYSILEDGSVQCLE